MDYKAIIKTVAPWISAAIGGPLGSLANQAIADAFGLPNKTDEAIATSVTNATAEQLLVLKQTDQAFALQMQALGFKQLLDMEALLVGDRANAREREIKTGDNTNKVLAAVIVLAWAVVNVVVLKYPVPGGSEQLVARMLGTMDAALMCVLYYYFSSSAGSNRKTELMAQQTASKT